MQIRYIILAHSSAFVHSWGVTAAYTVHRCLHILITLLITSLHRMTLKDVDDRKGKSAPLITNKSEDRNFSAVNTILTG